MNQPVLVLGAGGFIGANIFKTLSKSYDVYGTTSSKKSWRLPESKKIIRCDLARDTHLSWLLSEVKPKTIINCAAYGAYSFEKDIVRIYQTNFNLVYRILHQIKHDCIYVHAGTSSEYGLHSTKPHEEVKLTPNSDYAVAKVAASTLIEYCGRHLYYPCVNLRLYSVYGPLEDSSRLIPQIIINGSKNKLPEFVSEYITRDFIYIDDVVEAFRLAAEALSHGRAITGESFNICTGNFTRMDTLAFMSRRLFNLQSKPKFTMPHRSWDPAELWQGDSKKAAEILDFHHTCELETGLLKTIDWYKNLDDKESYIKSSKILN